MSSLGPHSIRDRPVTVHVDHTLLREGGQKDRAGTAWRVRKEPSIEILGAGEFEGPHWDSLRRRDSANRWKDTGKPRPILVKWGDIAAKEEI
jgi:hypothetical protein